MRYRILVALAFSLELFVSLGASAEATSKILRIQPIAGDALSQGESTAVQNLVTSYVVEFKAFRVIDAAGQELALKEAETAVQLGVPKDIEALAADYILSANALKAGSLLVFTMDLTKVSTGEKRSVAETSPSVNELILALRRLTRSLFEQGQDGQVAAMALPSAASATAETRKPAEQGAAMAKDSPQTVAEAAPSFNPAPSLAMITGSWRGDKGLDRVTIFRDGRGIAILSGGKSMRVRASISGSSVIVVQDQPSSPDFYKNGSIDLKTARAIAAKARPWRWVFSLASNKASLVGTKESVFVRMDANGQVNVDNNYVRDASWSRLYR